MASALKSIDSCIVSRIIVGFKENSGRDLHLPLDKFAAEDFFACPKSLRSSTNCELFLFLANNVLQFMSS